jgi:two-component system, chemotaxis family, response regulator Rcp1
LNAKEAKVRTSVLIVEDNPVDVRMIRLALREQQNWPTDVAVASDGENAVQYLLHQGPYQDAHKPDLLILDLNLPKRHGTEILQIVRTNDELSDLPVIILSSSPEDVIRDTVKRSHFTADLCLTKPVNVKDYLALGSAFHKCYKEAQAASGSDTNP